MCVIPLTLSTFCSVTSVWSSEFGKLASSLSVSNLQTLTASNLLPVRRLVQDPPGFMHHVYLSCLSVLSSQGQLLSSSLVTSTLGLSVLRASYFVACPSVWLGLVLSRVESGYEVWVGTPRSCCFPLSVSLGGTERS